MIFEKQLTIKPDHYPWTKDYIKAFQTSMWTSEEFNFQSDINDFKVGLTKQEQQLIERSISAIAQIEVEVKEFWSNLGNTLPHPSISDLGDVLAYTEVVHKHAYIKLLEVLNLEEKLEENLNNPVLKDRVQYLNKHREKASEDFKQQFLYKLILFSILIENVSLFSQFYIITYFNRFKNQLKDTAQQVQYTLNEESLHAQIGFKLINVIRQEHPELFTDELDNLIRTRLEKAIVHEYKMIDWIFEDFEPVDEILHPETIKSYITDRMNNSFIEIGYDNIQFELDQSTLNEAFWMKEEEKLTNMTDFFYKKPIDYSKNNRSEKAEDLF